MNHIPLALPAPYVGLRPFEEKDAVLFFGRDAQVRDLLAKLENKQRFISVLGASGSGKSSLVRAGLIPALHQAELASAGYRWKAHIIKPGDAPLHQLVKKLTEDPRWIDNDDRATSMASLHSELSINPLGLTELYRQRANLFGEEALLLVVDQFEEIFHYRQQNIDATEAFIKLLLCSASEDVPIYVVMTLRSDFLDNCAAFVNLPEAINSGLYLMPRLRPDQLRSIIVSPLALVNGNIDPVLVNRLMNTPGGENELPVLEHALLRMWNHAQADGRRNIEEQDFSAICKPQCAESDESTPKLEFAIDNHASEIFDHLTWRQKHIAHQLFLSLIGHREIRDVHRPQTFTQLIELIGEQERGNLLAVINAFREEGASFLLPPIKENILDGELIAISYDNLLRQCHPFQQWLTEETRNVTELVEWQQRASRQSNKEDWLDECDCERALRWLDRISEHVEQQRWAARLTDPGNFARIKTYIETSKKRLEEARIERERQRKEKLGAETKRLEATVRLHSELAENAENKKLQAEVLAQTSLRNSYFAIATAIAAILFALISIGSENGTNQVKNRAEEMAKNAQTRKIPPSAENLSQSTPDQSILFLLAAQQISAIPEVEAYLRFALTNYTFQNILRAHEGPVYDTLFSPDGKTILTASADRTVRLWDTATGKPMHVLQGHEGAVYGALFSPDGKTVLTRSTDKTVRLWNTATGQSMHVLQGYTGAVYSTVFSPEGKTILTVSSDKTARLWDAATGKQLHVLHGHEGVVYGALFSPDGKTILTMSSDKTARLWSAATGQSMHVLQGHEGVVHGALFSPSGNTILTRSTDKTARLWDTVTGKQLQVLQEHEGAVYSALFSPDGKTIFTRSIDNTARLWDTATGKQLHVLQGHEGTIYGALFSPDGDTILTVSSDKTARLWNAATGQSMHILRGHEEVVYGALFSPDGHTILTRSKDKTARLWDAATGEQLHALLGHEEAVYDALFSPDGKSILTASADNTIRLWSCNVCRLIEEIATDLRKRVEKDLTEEASRRFGVPDQ